MKDMMEKAIPMDWRRNKPCARILCVADLDAMVSERPYSKSMTMEQAFKELEKNAGTQFDPEIVKIFIKIMKARAA